MHSVHNAGPSKPSQEPEAVEPRESPVKGSASPESPPSGQSGDWGLVVGSTVLDYGHSYEVLAFSMQGIYYGNRHGTWQYGSGLCREVRYARFDQLERGRWAITVRHNASRT